MVHLGMGRCLLSSRFFPESHTGRHDRRTHASVSYQCHGPGKFICFLFLQLRGHANTHRDFGGYLGTATSPDSWGFNSRKRHVDVCRRAEYFVGLPRQIPDRRFRSSRFCRHTEIGRGMVSSQVFLHRFRCGPVIFGDCGAVLFWPGLL